MELYRSEVSEKFTDLFIGIMGFTEEEFCKLISYFRREYVPRNFFYIKAGQVTKQKAYINKGSSRTFTIDEKGKEHVFFFAFEDWWIGDIESYHTGQPGSLYVQAMEDCELLCINKTDFDRLQIEIPKLEQWNQVKMTKNLFANLSRLNEIKTLTVEERYLKLLEKHPQIFQRIPLQYIASYLDIKPPSLSRLRKRLSSK